MSDYYKYTNGIPDAALIAHLVARKRDVEQLIAIISCSYDYVRKLPLKGLTENYSKGNTDLLDLVL